MLAGMADKITAVLEQFLPDEPDEAWEFLLTEALVRGEDHDAFVDVLNGADMGDIGAVTTALGEASLLAEAAYDNDDGIADRVATWRDQ